MWAFSFMQNQIPRVPRSPALRFASSFNKLDGFTRQGQVQPLSCKRRWGSSEGSLEFSYPQASWDSEEFLGARWLFGILDRCRIRLGSEKGLSRRDG